MVAVAWPIEGLRRLSRRAITGLFAGGSVLASRPAADLLARASDLFDLGFGLFTIYQTLGGGNTLVSPILTYVAFGYLVYAYIPDLYIERFGNIVEARGFRALTAVTTLYIGLLIGQMTGSAPDQGLFVHLPQDVGGIIVALLAGFIVITVVFSGYIHLVRGERLFDRSGAPFETLDVSSIRSIQGKLEKIESLPRRRRHLLVALYESEVGILYVTPAIILGLALAVLGLLSPIPEGLVVVAVLGSYAPLGGRLPWSLPDRIDSDIEFRIADNLIETIQNPKGMCLSVFCILGILTSGLFLVGGISFLIGAGRSFLEAWPGIVAIPDVLGDRSLSELGVLSARLWANIGVGTSLMTFSLYSLLYWFRQLQRLPAYVPFWQAYWQGESSSPPMPSVTRPPGLFLPGNALLLGLGAATWLIMKGSSLMGWVVFGVVWPVLVGIVVWSVRAGYRHPPQPLRGEGRAVVFAFGIQFVSFGVAVVVLTQQSPWPIFGTLLVLVGFMYSPEVSMYSERRQGAAHYLSDLYWAGLVAVSLFVVESLGSVPLVVYLIAAGLLLMSLLIKIILSSHAGPSTGE
ncbi:hypothetical protein [Haloarcula sp. 1CSR25-25]|uniref:hypothetical protein n=1 Tax=Haloarcula sp. 1CSR25-25 TaxID=2862545 RepID=UPI0028958E1F|nr:hypothetical protein [Haloarcula sp. 1CSR25-25]MDT3434706.1 hypothetical protein [Haloarcula sp. 1CSR25-25]